MVHFYYSQPKRVSKTCVCVNGFASSLPSCLAHKKYTHTHTHTHTHTQRLRETNAQMSGCTSQEKVQAVLFVTSGTSLFHIRVETRAIFPNIYSKYITCRPRSAFFEHLAHGWSLFPLLYASSLEKKVSKQVADCLAMNTIVHS